MDANFTCFFITFFNKTGEKEKHLSCLLFVKNHITLELLMSGVPQGPDTTPPNASDVSFNRPSRSGEGAQPADRWNRIRNGEQPPTLQDLAEGKGPQPESSSPSGSARASETRAVTGDVIAPDASGNAAAIPTTPDSTGGGIGARIQKFIDDDPRARREARQDAAATAAAWQQARLQQQQEENAGPGVRDRAAGMAGRAADAIRGGAGRAGEVARDAAGRVVDAATSETGRRIIDAGAELGLSAAERKFENAADKAARKHGERIAKARKGFLGHLGKIGAAKTIGLAIADLHSTATWYGVGDALVAGHALHHLYQSSDQNRSPVEREMLARKGKLKLVAAAIPFIPGSLTAPLIDAKVNAEYEERLAEEAAHKEGGGS